VGRPVSYLLKSRGYNVEVADTKTENIEQAIKSADIIISATGHPKLITGDIIRPGAVVLDAGTSESEGGIVGDIDFDSIKDAAGFVSPVPGGIGPVTVAMLLSNVLKVAQSVQR
jgi:methylenetetrahydrofolate dehydrogenase (NADP+)/methenyltetrahydrofolate cyclohydrolase